MSTIILIDENQNRKKCFMEILKQKLNFSYTKAEVLFQTVQELYDDNISEFNKEIFLSFFNKLLEKLSHKNEVNLIDIDNFSTKNSIALLKKHTDLMIIYLQKIDNEEQVIQINGDNIEEVNDLVKEIINRSEIWKN